MEPVAKFAASTCKPGLILRWSHFCVYIQQTLTKSSFAPGTAWQEVTGSTLEVFTVVVSHTTTQQAEGTSGERSILQPLLNAYPLTGFFTPSSAFPHQAKNVYL